MGVFGFLKRVFGRGARTSGKISAKTAEYGFKIGGKVLKKTLKKGGKLTLKGTTYVITSFTKDTITLVSTGFGKGEKTKYNHKELEHLLEEEQLKKVRD